MTVDIQEKAEDNLRFIRGAMERAERVSAVSGAGAMAMGVIALIAMAVSATLDDLNGQLLIWIGTAFIAGTTGSVACALKARRNEMPFFADPGRRFLLCLIPSLLVGVVLTAALLPGTQASLLPGLWMMLYGAGVLAAGTYAAPPVMHMGGGFLVLGVFAQALPESWANVLLGLSFGLLHLYFGYQVFRHHGG
jgi:hypothetical protein